MNTNMYILAPDEILFGNTPIPVHDTWQIMDATKIKSLMGCPRDFFYSYILGWRKESNNIHLGFGSAWHKALEVFYLNGNGKDVVKKAYEAFCEEIEKNMGTTVDLLNMEQHGKTPAKALLALEQYDQEWTHDPSEILHIEEGGSVPIADDRVLHVKLDVIGQYNEKSPFAGKHFGHEHKTTSRQTQAWENQWDYDFQVGAYDYFLKSLFGSDNVHGVVINAAVFNKTQRRFLRFPITRSEEMLGLWLYEANEWWDTLERYMEQLYSTTVSVPVMKAFPRNGASCSKFGCRHPELCSFKGNPLHRCEHPPEGYKVEFWDPRKVDESED